MKPQHWGLLSPDRRFALTTRRRDNCTRILGRRRRPVAPSRIPRDLGASRTVYGTYQGSRRRVVVATGAARIPPEVPGGAGSRDVAWQRAVRSARARDRLESGGGAPGGTESAIRAAEAGARGGRAGAVALSGGAGARRADRHALELAAAGVAARASERLGRCTSGSRCLLWSALERARQRLASGAAGRTLRGVAAGRRRLDGRPGPPGAATVVETDPGELPCVHPRLPRRLLLRGGPAVGRHTAATLWTEVRLGARVEALVNEALVRLRA